MKKYIGTTWEQLPDTSFVLQCQSRSGMRIVKSAVQPTKSNAGYFIGFNEGVDTDIQGYLEGTCWIKAEHGENQDYEYEARV